MFRACICFILLFSALCNNVFGEDFKAEFSAANDLYSNGNYSQALEKYEKILESYSSPEVMYNAGCAALRMDRKGIALYYWRHALENAPRDHALANAEKTLEEQILKDGGIISRPSDIPIISNFTENEIAFIFLSFFFFIFTLTLINRKWKKDLFWVYFALWSGFVLSGASLAVSEIRFSGSFAAVSSPSAEIRDSQNINSPCFYILKDGSEVKILAIEHGWLRVAFVEQNGKYHEGWAPEKDFIKL